jgi:hypothetical protein
MTTTTYAYHRTHRSDADRTAFRWNWIVILGSGRTDAISAEYDESFGGIAVLRNGDLIGMYEGRRWASSIGKAAKRAIVDIYG